MGPVDVNRLVEDALAEASAIGAAQSDPTKKLAAGRNGDVIEAILATDENTLNDLVDELMHQAEQEEKDEQVKTAELVERGRHVKMAKVLAAFDVLTGVQR